MPTSAHWGVSNAPKISVKSVQSAWADVGIGPYNAFKNRVGIFELFLVSRERSKKTEAVFLVGSRRPGGKSKSPGPQMISICVLTLTRTSLTAEYYSAQVHRTVWSVTGRSAGCTGSSARGRIPPQRSSAAYSGAFRRFRRALHTPRARRAPRNSAGGAFR